MSSAKARNYHRCYHCISLYITASLPCFPRTRMKSSQHGRFSLIPLRSSDQESDIYPPPPNSIAIPKTGAQHRNVLGMLGPYEDLYMSKVG